jgi:phosphatidylinositol alpha 1,6-mannosyltransferase
MRIAYFTESLLPLVDGVSLTLSRLFTTLEEEGVDFRIYSPFVPGPELAWSHRVRGVRSFRFPLYRDYRVSLPGGRALRRDLQAFRPTLVHLVSPTPMALWAQSWARRRGIPPVASFHTDFISYFPYYRVGPLMPLGWRALRWFHNRCAATFVPSPPLERQLSAHGLRGVENWSRGIDARRFSPERRETRLRAEWGADEERQVLLFVGRLVREKDLLELPEVQRRLRTAGHDPLLVMVGDGPLRQELEAALPDAVFRGHLEGAELARHYASADLFLFPSTTETFGNVVLEAAASGLPAVVAGKGGPPALVAHGSSGLVARPNDPADFAASVASLLGDRERLRAMGRAARELAVGRDWTRINRDLVERYREICGGTT